MADLKSVLGAVIIIFGVLALVVMLVSNALGLKVPKFIKNNHFEITFLIIVSCIMGLVLLIF